MLTYIDAAGRKTTVSVANPLPTSGGGGGSGSVQATYNSTPPTLTNGQKTDLQADSRGNLEVSLWSGANAIAALTAGADAGSNTTTGLVGYSRGYVFNGSTWDRQAGNTTGTFTVGNVAAGAADAGNPVKVGAVFLTTPPTLTTGQRANLQTGSTGSLKVQLMGNDANTPIDYVGGGIDNASSAVNTIITGNYNRVFNGTGWDRVRTAVSADGTSGVGLAGSGNLFKNPYTGNWTAVPGDTTGVHMHGPVNAPSDMSGTIAASGGTASIAFVNSARQEVINPSTATLWARWGGVPAVNGAGSFPIAPGGTYSTDRTAGTLQLLSTAANQPYTVTRFA